MSHPAPAAGRFVGQSVLRVEDPRILQGQGRYVADVSIPRMLHAVFVRSLLAHAGIAEVDTRTAVAHPGVTAVYTARDLDQVVAPLRVDAPPGHARPSFGPLASDRVRHVGDPIAIVLAESREVGEDAAELVEVDYDALAPVTGRGSAGSEVVLFDGLATNLIFGGETAYGDIETAVGAADVVVCARLHQQRYANVPLEPRGGIATFDSGSRDLMYVASTQNPQGLRAGLAAALGLPLQDVHVTSGDVGGGFGQKMVVYREDIAVCAASLLSGRPVRWIEDRAENLSAGGQAREETVELEAAARSDGRLLGLRGSIVLDQGAYPALPFPASAFTAHVRALLPDAYRFGAFAFEESVVATNKASYVPYRGPWCSAPWAREVLLDRIARRLGIEPAELRLRNLARSAEQTTTITGASLAGARPRETLERLLEIVDVPAFRARQEAARREGRLLGIGIATLIEPAPGPADFGDVTGFPAPPERAVARIEPDGSLTVLTSQHPHGQGHETTLAQVAADELGVELEGVRVVHGDTRISPFGVLGTSGSRGAARGGGAVIAATQDVRRQVLEIAGALLEIAPNDLDIAGGSVHAVGSPRRSLQLAEIAAAAYFGSAAVPAGAAGMLEGAGTHDDSTGGWSSATHCCIAEVDADTGLVSIERYLVVHDCGTVINPAIVAGQISGGVAQGIGGALLEESVYDEEGQYLAATFADYLLPTTMDVPAIEIVNLEPESERREFRGVGEGGAIGAPPSVTNAVVDAIGVDIDELPLTPERVLEALSPL